MSGRREAQEGLRSPLFVGGGEMATLCREFDWASTPIGPIERWPRALCTMSDAVIASRNPMLLMWGADLIQFYNDAFRPSLGMATGPLARHPRALGMRAREFWTDIWEVIGPQLDAVMTRGESVWEENLLLPIERDGRLDDAWWTYSYSPVRDDDGEIGGVLVVCLETTETVRARVEAETERARSSAILDGMADAHLVLDDRFRIVSANRKMVRNVGLPRARMLGRSVWELFPGLRNNPFETALRRAAADQVEEHLTEHYHDDRLDLIAEVDAYPTPERGVAIFWRDITERVRIDEERERALAEAETARAEAESANRAKADFLAVMSHELRTPLNAISGYVDLLAHGVHGQVTPEQRSALERIQRNQRHLLGLINGVLNYARVDAGSVSYQLEAFAISEELAACEALVATRARQNGLELEYLPCEPSVIVRADREKVQQIILNLLGNAVKFTDGGGRITLECIARDGRTIVVRVVDTGRGIPPERLESVFHPFVQVESGLTRPHEGVGLGLAISRDLARGMGGDLTAKSEPGRGSTFELELPRAVEQGG